MAVLSMVTPTQLGNSHRSVMQILGFVVAMCMAGPLPAWAANCRVPEYREFVWDLAPGGRYSQLWVRSRDVTMPNLLCLFRSLRESQPQGTSVWALVFDEEDAARQFFNLSPGTDIGIALPEERAPDVRGRQARHLRAWDSFNPDEPSDAFVLCPMGWGWAWREACHNRVAPVNGRPGPLVCEQALQERCLLKMDPLEYPPDVRRRHVTGTVTLSGRVNRAGRMTRVRVVTSAPTAAAPHADLVRMAVANLHSWRVDPGPSNTDVQIAFTYALEKQWKPGLGPPGPDGIGDIEIDLESVQVFLALPTRVTVEASPLP